MERRIMYVELKTGHDDDGPARIGWVGRSKTGHTLYYGDLVLRKLKGEEQSGFHVDDETGEKLLKLMDLLNEHDDVQNVFANFEVSDALIAKMGG